MSEISSIIILVLLAAYRFAESLVSVERRNDASVKVFLKIPLDNGGGC